jgi:hypothetical protein
VQISVIFCPFAFVALLTAFDRLVYWRSTIMGFHRGSGAILALIAALVVLCAAKPTVKAPAYFPEPFYRTLSLQTPALTGKLVVAALVFTVVSVSF